MTEGRQPPSVEEVRALHQRGESWAPHAKERIAQLQEALAFAASVIKSGEGWSSTCERIIGGALRGGKDERDG